MGSNLRHFNEESDDLSTSLRRAGMEDLMDDPKTRLQWNKKSFQNYFNWGCYNMIPHVIETSGHGANMGGKFQFVLSDPSAPTQLLGGDLAERRPV